LTDPKQAITEAEAIEQAKQGHEAAFEVCITCTTPRVFAMFAAWLPIPPRPKIWPRKHFFSCFGRYGTFRGESAFLDLAAPHDGQRRPDATAQEGFAGGVGSKRRWKRTTRHPGRNSGQGSQTDGIGRTGCSCSGRSTSCRQAIERFLCCTMWRFERQRDCPNGGLLDWQQQVALHKARLKLPGIFLKS